MCFWVLCVFFGVWKREKRAEKLGREHKIKKKKKCLLFWSEGCLGLFIAPTHFSRRRLFKDRQPQKAFDRVDLDNFGKILIFSF